MGEYVLAFKPAIGNYGVHDPSAVIFKDGDLMYGIEEERLNRQKHAEGDFPVKSIQACLDFCKINLHNLDKIILPYKPSLQSKILFHQLRQSALKPDSFAAKLDSLNYRMKKTAAAHFAPKEEVRQRLISNFGEPLPEIENKPHHDCHAGSAFYPSGFENALTLTLDGQGEYDATVVWEGTPGGLDRLRTYKFPNSLGHFYGIVTEFLGYRAFNGEGKIMGLAPYGDHNSGIESKLLELIDVCADYDVTPLTENGIKEGVTKLEEIFSKERNSKGGEFSDWEKDLAYVTQSILEEIVTSIVRKYSKEYEYSDVAMAGGVALNCKMNKRVMEVEEVDNVFVQPVAHDAGLAIGAGMLDYKPNQISEMSTVYWGPEYTNDEIKDLLETNKIDFYTPDDLEKEVANKLASGNIVGWFQGRLEMGPRALGNRSILADPRTIESRDRVNKYVKHREKWRPFAPSMLEEQADRYLTDAETAPYMIKTFDTKPDHREDIEAVLHPGDNTTRPQTVSHDQNPKYYQLISEFEEITGVPVLLNTSFNDHGEPIVNTPTEALKDFYGMGLDVLVLNDLIIEK